MHIDPWTVILSVVLATLVVEVIHRARPKPRDLPPATDIGSDMIAAEAPEDRPRLTVSRVPSEFVLTSPRCDVCGVNLPVGAVRRHDGHWRCADHKEQA